MLTMLMNIFDRNNPKTFTAFITIYTNYDKHEKNYADRDIEKQFKIS